MKITVTMKTPDAVHHAMEAAAECEDDHSPDNDERDERLAVTKDALDYWFKYGECLSIEFDTDAMTATVLPAK